MSDLNLSLKKTISEAEVKKLLEQSDWGQGRSETQISQQIHASHFVFSVWDGEKVVAFCRVLTDHSYIGVILDFIVHKKYQGRGVGTRLMKALLGHTDLIGINKWVVFSPMNQDFFRQFNFEKSEEAMIRYG